MRRLLFSMAVLGLTSALAIGATTAYFSDTEISSANTFVSGTLDLKVNGEDDGENFFHIDLNNLKPGDGVGGAEHSTITYQWTLSNAGSITGRPSIEIVNIQDNENGCNESESDVDTTCEDPGVSEGELSDHIYVQINAPGSADFMYPHGTGCIDGGRSCPLSYWANSGKIGYSSWELITGNSSLSPLVLEFKVPTNIGNIIQSDSVSFDIKFNLEQAI